MIEREGFGYMFDETKCAECGGKCCIGDGYVFLSIKECQQIAEFLDMDLDMFGLKFLRKIGDRYALIENPNSDRCIFLDEKNECKIYRVRPKNCKSFPFWEVFKNNIKGAMRECIGVVEKS